MSSYRRAGAPALLATLALAASTVPSTGIPFGLFTGSPSQTAVVASSSAADLTPDKPAGSLVLSTARTTGAVTFTPTAGDSLTQPFKEGLDCAIDTTPDLLRMSGQLTNKSGGVSETVAGFRSGSIGVRETRLEQYCNQVDTTTPLWAPMTETLVLSLNPATLKDDFGPLKANAQESLLKLKMRSKGTVTIEVKATLDNGAQTTKTYTTTTATVGLAVDLPLTDLGVFDTLTLKSVKGGFSLESGTAFALVGTAEKTLDCTDPSITEGSATATFVGNAGSTSSCTGEGFGVVLTNGENFTELLKPLNVDADAQFVFDLTWTEVANTDWPSAAPLFKRTTADFDGDAAGSNPPVEIAWCPDLVETTVGDATFLVVENVATNAGLLDQAPGYPANEDTKQYACIISQKPTLDSTTDQLTVVEQVYVYGDIKLVR